MLNLTEAGFANLVKNLRNLLVTPVLYVPVQVIEVQSQLIEDRKSVV